MRFPSLFRSSYSHVTSSPYAQATGDDTEREGDGRGLLVRARASETQAYPVCDTISHALGTGPWPPHETKTPRVLELSSLHFSVIIYSPSKSGPSRLMRLQPSPSPGFC